ncbi:MAG: MFS transporter [Chloroflexota bacterium]
MSATESTAAQSTDARTHAEYRADSRIFYGWLIVLASALGMFATGPGQTFTVAIFVDPIGASLGLSKTAVSTAYTIGGTLASILVLQAGRLIDRFGTRRSMVGIGVVFGLTCAAMSTVSGMIGLVIGFMALRIGGPGALSLASTILPTRWFVRRRGLAMGLVMLGVGLSQAVLPTGTQLLVEAVGWRTAWLGLAVMVGVLVIVPALLLVRDRPEDMGLEPDGLRSPPASGGRTVSTVRTDWTLRQAVRTRAFWILMATGVISSSVGTGIIFHQVSYFTSQGLLDELFVVFAVFAVAQTTSMAVMGIVVDRVPPRYALAGQYVLLALAIVLLLLVGTAPLLVPIYALIAGVAMGGNGTLSSVIWPTYFGTRHVATLRSMDSGIKMISAAVGPLPLALAFDFLGGFGPGLLVFCGLAVMAALLSVACRPPVAPLEAVADAAH